MERVDQAKYAKRELIRSSYEERLRSLFPPCREPLPPKIEQLLGQLDMPKGRDDVCSGPKAL